MRDVILDGESTWGKPGTPYHVFDLLSLDGRDVTMLRLDERRELLDTLGLRSPVQRVSACVHRKMEGSHCEIARFVL